MLAQKRKLNPDSWPDLKKTLPLLAKAEYTSRLKYGYARGGAPVVFVENIRAYYDILLRMERPYAPKLRVVMDHGGAAMRPTVLVAIPSVMHMS